MTVVFHPRVFSEVDAIMRYYEDIAGPRLADDFYDEFRLFVQHASQLSGKIQHSRRRIKTRQSEAFPLQFPSLYVSGPRPDVQQARLG